MATSARSIWPWSGSAALAGSGTFYRLIHGDFNGDGKLDLSWIASGHGIVTALGNGDGTFDLIQTNVVSNPIPQSNHSIDQQQNMEYTTVGGLAVLVIRTYNYGDSSGNVDVAVWDSLLNGLVGGGGVLTDLNSQMFLGLTPNDGIGHEAGSNVLVGDFNDDRISDIMSMSGASGRTVPLPASPNGSSSLPAT